MAVSLIEVLDLIRLTKIKSIDMYEHGMSVPVTITISRRFNGCLGASYNGLDCSFSQLDKHLYRITSRGEWISRVISGRLVINEVFEETVANNRSDFVASKKDARPYNQWSTNELAKLNSMTLDRLLFEEQITPERLAEVILHGCGYAPMPAVKRPKSDSDSISAVYDERDTLMLQNDELRFLNEKYRSTLQQIAFHLERTEVDKLPQDILAMKQRLVKLESDLKIMRDDTDHAIYHRNAFGYDRVFHSIASAVSLSAGYIAISVRDFENAMIAENPKSI